MSTADTLQLMISFGTFVVTLVGLTVELIRLHDHDDDDKRKK